MQFVMLLLLILIGAGSLLVWWQIFYQLRHRLPVLPLERRSDEPRRLLTFVSLIFVWLLLRWLTVVVFGAATESSLLTLKLVCLNNVLVLVVSPAVLFSDKRVRPVDWGFRWSEWKQQVSDGVAGFAACLIPVAVVQILTMVSGLRGPDIEQRHPLLKLLEEDPSLSTVLWVGAAAVILAPLAEEFIFRVVIQGYLQTWVPPWLAILSASALFAAVHSWPDPLPLFPLALVLGYAYYRRNSFLAVVVLHALFNLVNLLMALLSIDVEAQNFGALILETVGRLR